MNTIEPKLWKLLGNYGVKIKINNMNRTIIKAGAYRKRKYPYWKTRYAVCKLRTRVPAIVNNELVGTELGSINYTRTFNFK